MHLIANLTIPFITEIEKGSDGAKGLQSTFLSANTIHDLLKKELKI